MKTREDLKTDYYLQTGEEWLNSQNEPDIDYVQWLEDKILSSLKSMRDEKEEKPERKPDWMPDDDMVIGIDIIKRDAEITHEQTIKNIEKHFKNLKRNLIASANDILRSCYQVIERKGESTNWDALEKKVKKVLEEQHSYLYPDSLQSSPQPQPGRGAEEVLEKYFPLVNAKEDEWAIHVCKAMEEYRTQSEGKDMYPKEPLQTIEVCEQGEIVVMAKQGKNIIDVGRECIALANYLSLAVKLHFNQKVIRIFKNTEVGEIINSK